MAVEFSPALVVLAIPTALPFTTSGLTAPATLASVVSRRVISSPTLKLPRSCRAEESTGKERPITLMLVGAAGLGEASS